jgi:hypothetical protein
MPLCNVIRIFFILLFECCQLFAVSSISSAAWESRMSCVSASSKSWSHQSHALWSNTRMYLVYFIMLFTESLLFIDCFMPNFFQQLYRAVDLSLSRNHFYNCYAVSCYDYQHLLTQKFPHLHLRYCERCGKCISSWMFLRLPVQEAVRLRYWCWKDMQLGCRTQIVWIPWGFFKNMSLNARFLDFGYIF